MKIQAHRDVRCATDALVKQRDKDAERYVAKELRRLEQLDFSLAAGIAKGDVDAVNAARRVSESRRRLLGLDAAQQIELTGRVPFAIEARVELANLSDEELDRRLARVCDALQQARMALPAAAEAPQAPDTTPEGQYAAELERRRASAVTVEPAALNRI